MAYRKRRFLHLKRQAVIHLIQETFLLTIPYARSMREDVMQDEVKREFFPRWVGANVHTVQNCFTTMMTM